MCIRDRCIALVCIFILVFSLSHKAATKGSANPPLTDVLTDSISQIVSACPGEIGVAVIINNTDTVLSLIHIFAKRQNSFYCTHFCCARNMYNKMNFVALQAKSH